MKLEILAYEPTRSSDLPPLLFVHGACHGAWCWKEHFLPYFCSKGFSCYTPSLQGHGESEGIEKLHTFSLDDYRDDVLEVMAHLKERPVLIGHSMGGAIVQKIVHAYPGKVRMVILLAAVPPQGIMLRDHLRLLLTYFKGMFQVKLFSPRKSLEIAALLFFSENLTAEEKDRFTKLLQPESRQARRDLGRQIVPMSTGGTVSCACSGLAPQVPMLVLGSKKDAFFPEKTVKSIGKAYKTHPIVFPDISHDMMLDPEWRRVADVMHTFLCETISSEEKGAL